MYVCMYVCMYVGPGALRAGAGGRGGAAHAAGPPAPHRLGAQQRCVRARVRACVLCVRVRVWCVFLHSISAQCIHSLYTVRECVCVCVFCVWVGVAYPYTIYLSIYTHIYTVHAPPGRAATLR